MAKRNTEMNSGDITEGAIPMKDASGRKYKVRVPAIWEPENVPTVEGKLVAKGKHEVNGKDRYFVILDGEKGLFRVYESKALEDLFKLGALGDSVRLKFSGYKDLGSGQRFKKIAVEVFSE